MVVIVLAIPGSADVAVRLTRRVGLTAKDDRAFGMPNDRRGTANRVQGRPAGDGNFSGGEATTK